MTANGRRSRAPAAAVLVAGALAACATPVPQVDRGRLAFSDATMATAVVQPFHGSGVGGVLAVEPLGNGIRISGTLAGFPRSGPYGFHIKHSGDCASPEASGPVFNPHATRHGEPSAGEYMLGGLPNIEATAAGNATLNLQVVGVTLGGGGYNDIAGRSLVVHEAADDHRSQPEGNAGRRIACAVITVTNPPPVV